MKLGLRDAEASFLFLISLVKVWSLGAELKTGLKPRWLQFEGVEVMRSSRCKHCIGIMHVVGSLLIGHLGPKKGFVLNGGKGAKHVHTHTLLLPSILFIIKNLLKGLLWGKVQWLTMHAHVCAHAHVACSKVSRSYQSGWRFKACKQLKPEVVALPDHPPGPSLDLRALISASWSLCPRLMAAGPWLLVSRFLALGPRLLVLGPLRTALSVLVTHTNCSCYVVRLLQDWQF